MAKIKLLHLMGAPKPGGAETFFIRLMVALHGRPDVQVLPVVRNGSWAAGRLAALGIPHRTAPFGGWGDRYIFGRTANVLRGVVDEFKPDVVQGWMNRATGYIGTIKGRGGFKTVGRLGGYYDLKYYRNNVTHLIANTKDIVDYCVREGWPKARVEKVDNFIPLPPVGWQQHRATARAKWGIPAKATVMVMSGRLHPVKGIDVALRAMAKLPANVWLLLGGAGPARAELEALAKELGVEKRVVFAGWQDAVEPSAAAADVWLAPSRHEPLGNTVLDAWAHQLPVVASLSEGPRVLIEDGKNGLLVPVDDVDALAAAVKRLLDDEKLAKKMAKAGWATYKERFSEEVVVAETLGYYRRLVGGKI